MATEAIRDIPERILNTSQLAERWGTSLNYIASLRYAGMGPAWFQHGPRGKVHYRMSDVLAYEEHQLRGGPRALRAEG